MATYDRYTAAGTQLTVTSIGQMVDANRPVADLSSDLNTLGGIAADQFTYAGTSFTFIGTVELGSQLSLGSSLAYGFIGQAPDGGLSLFLPHGEPSIARLTNLTLRITPPPGEAAEANDWTLTTVGPSCLLEGTLLRTPEGERPIEALRAGDPVMTTDGTHKPIRWIGRSTITRFGRDSLSLFPIRIRAGALDEAMPERDLLISPNLATFINDVLIQAGALVNGVSIVQETQMPPIFTYYSVELAEHTFLVAEGTLVESFLDRAERSSFDNWAERGLLAGTPAASAEMAFPRVKSARQVPTAVRTMLLAQQLRFLTTNQVAA